MIIVANENRPDLASGLDKKTIAGAATLVGPQIFPPMIVGEKTSTIQVAKVNRGGGVKNRTKGQNLTGTRVESIPMQYTVNSYEGLQFPALSQTLATPTPLTKSLPPLRSTLSHRRLRKSRTMENRTLSQVRPSSVSL